MATTAPPSEVEFLGEHASAEVMYTANIVQLFVGILVCIANAFGLASIMFRNGNRVPQYILMANMCLVNLIVGVMLSVANVVDGWYEVTLLKTESVLVSLNSFITVVTLLILLITSYPKSNRGFMTARAMTKAIFAIWAIALSMLFIKALVFALDRLEKPGACYRCFVVFELVILMLLLVGCFLAFTIICFKPTAKRSEVQNKTQSSNVEEARSILLTAVIILITYCLCFLLFFFLYMTWFANAGTVKPGAAEIMVALYFLHCLISPIVILQRHKDLSDSLRNIICCGLVDPSPDDRMFQQSGTSPNQEYAVEVPSAQPMAIAGPSELRIVPSSPQQQIPSVSNGHRLPPMGQVPTTGAPEGNLGFTGNPAPWMAEPGRIYSATNGTLPELNPPRNEMGQTGNLGFETAQGY